MSTRVLHVFGSMDIGGAEMRTLELLQAIQDQEIAFDFAVLSGRKGALAADFEALGATIFPVPLGRTFPQEFMRLVRRQKYDVVHSHVATFSGLILLIAAIAGVPKRIAHFRSDGDGHPDTLRRIVQRSTMKYLIGRFATDIVGVSPSALSHGYRKDWENDRKARVIVNGLTTENPTVDIRLKLRRLIEVDESTPLVMHVGRPSPEKNRPRVVDVFQAIHEEMPTAHLVFIGGEGSDSNELRDKISDSGLGQHIHEIGRRKNAAELMAGADLLLLTSVREGLPGVVLEAASRGTPVVSSAVAGAVFISQHLTDVITLELTESNDQWARVCLDLMTRGSGDRTSNIKTFASSIFSQERTIQANLKLYERQ